MTNQEKVLKLAKTQLGVKEFVNGSNIQIETYHKFSTKKNDRGADDSVPWCSSFMCWCFESAGIQSTNDKSARSWLNFGQEIVKPKEGDIVVFWRESKEGWKGHVAIFIRFTASGDIVCLGGNQSDSVCLATYSKEKLLGFRTY